MIKTENLCFSYTGATPYVLDGVNLEIDLGQYVSVMGDNGCGKSTLMRILLGFERPLRGTVSVKAKRVGYVPQRKDFTGSAFPVTVYEALNSYRRLLRIKDKTAADKALELTGMTASAGELMGNLSGGQTQRVLIARAMMGDPDLMILDEPSAGVDAVSEEQIYSLLRRINRERGITVVSVEHNLRAAMANSTHIYHLMNGHGHMCTPVQYTREFLGSGRGRADV